MLQNAPSGLAPFAVSYDRIAERTIAPRWSARVLARLAARPLDRKLVMGADPAGSSLLAARACRLTSDDHRERLAAAIDRLLIAAGTPTRLVQVAPNMAALQGNAREFTELAALLRDGRPLYARGMAMLGRLVSDGTGPVYVGRAPILARRLAETRAALSG